MFKNIKNKSAFTLLEIIISVVILTVTIGAIYTLSTQTKKIMTKSEYSVTAMYLAQEGLEFVRTIRDESFSKSLNKEYGWNDFLKNSIGFSDIEKGGYKIKKLNIQKNGEFELLDSGVDFDKQISSLNDICSDIGVYENCIYEHVNIENLGNKNNDNFGKNFFRKIKIEKEFGETNLIKVYSEVFWEDSGILENFVLEQKIGNIAIN